MSLKDRLKLGATGAFPAGKLDKTDQGQLRMAMGVTPDGLVRLDFGKPVAWMAMAPDEAREMAALLLQCADKASARKA